MNDSPAPDRRALVKAGLLTALVSVVTFGVAHAIFITPLTLPDPEHPLWMRLGLMFIAPVAFGSLFALLVGLFGAAAWGATRRRGRLPSWRFGVPLAAAYLPALVLGFAFGPWGDEMPPGPMLVAVFAVALAIPAVAGGWAGGARGALLMPFAVLPALFPHTMFIVSGGEDGGVWIPLFAASILAVWVASGYWMERFVRRFSRRADESAHSKPI